VGSGDAAGFEPLKNSPSSMGPPALIFPAVVSRRARAADLSARLTGPGGNFIRVTSWRAKRPGTTATVTCRWGIGTIGGGIPVFSQPPWAGRFYFTGERTGPWRLRGCQVGGRRRSDAGSRRHGSMFGPEGIAGGRTNSSITGKYAEKTGELWKRSGVRRRGKRAGAGLGGRT